MTRINKEEYEEQIQQLKSVISENSRIIDNKFPDNVEILRGEYDMEGKLKYFRHENYIALAHTKNMNVIIW